MAADARVQAHAVDDGAGIQPARLGVGVQLVEKAHAQRQIGIGEELDGLRLRKSHNQGIDVLFQRPSL